MSHQRIRTIMVEDDPDFTFLIRNLLDSDDIIELLGYASNHLDAISLCKQYNPDIVLMDLNLTKNELDGVELAKKIRCSFKAKVIILTSFEDHDIITNSCVKCFASGYIYKKQFDMMIQTIKQTAYSCTPQEHLIFSLIVNQLSAAERTVLKAMAGKKIELYSSEKTIANQKTSILKKLGLNNTKELMNILDAGWKELV